MEEKINIAEILKDKPVGLKLYSPTFGCIRFNGVYKDKVYFYSEDTNAHSVNQYGKMYDGGECIIFPSKEMRDWRKFAWKKGDVLANSLGFKLFFDRWANDDYTRFFGKVNLLEDSFSYETEKYTLASKEETLDTLEIEKPEFKDGDIITIMPCIGDKLIYLFKAEDNEMYYGHAFLDGNIVIVNEDSYCQKYFCTVRPSTEEEKQQLFGALAKKGKAWDAEKKMIIDLKQKVELKPFDKVLVRNTDTEEWFPGLFEKFDSTWNNPYHIMNRRSMTDFAFKQCIPYEGNEHLLGTTKDVEG